jgi:POT family proton-dependent oligopeptide transporter
MELHIGFWAAFLLPFCMFVAGFATLIAGRKKYVVRPPRGSVIVNAFRAVRIGLLSKCDMDAAKPSYQDEYGRRHQTPWDDQFVEEIKRALVACKVFVYYPIYWTVYSQLMTNFISQGKHELGSSSSPYRCFSFFAVFHF